MNDPKRLYGIDASSVRDGIVMNPKDKLLMTQNYDYDRIKGKCIPLDPKYRDERLDNVPSYKTKQTDKQSPKDSVMSDFKNMEDSIFKTT